MELFSKIMGILGGSVLETATEFINERWPPDMSEAQKAEMNLVLKQFDDKERQREHERVIAINKITNEAEEQFNQRIKALEGTASDLKTIPIIGSVIIFARGVQRPIWGFGTLFLDYKIFSGSWNVQLVSVNEGVSAITPEGFCLIVINFLVLGFLFGERTLKNLLPLIRPLVESVWGRR